MQGFAVKFAAIQIAWTLQRVISTVHSAIRGGFMTARASPPLFSLWRFAVVACVNEPNPPTHTTPTHARTLGGILSYFRKCGLIKLRDEDTYLDEVVGVALAVRKQKMGMVNSGLGKTKTMRLFITFFP